MALPKLVPLFEPVPYQETTFSHDALGRHICNTWEEATVNPNFDVVIIGAGMYGAYCAAKLYQASESLGLRILVLEAGALLTSEHVQNLTQVGLDVADPIFGHQDNGLPRKIVWGLPWRGNQAFPGLAYCIGGKSLYWGGWSPRLTDADLAQWPAEVADYLRSIYETVEEEIGVEPKADYINGPLCDALKNQIMTALPGVTHLDSVDNAPLAVQGEPPEPGLFSFDKYSSAPILISALRDAAAKSGINDAVRRLFMVPRAHVARLHTGDGRIVQIELFVNGQQRFLSISPNCAVVLAASTIESTRLALESFPTAHMGSNLMAHLRSDFTVRIRRSVLFPAPPVQLEIAALFVGGHTPRGQFHQQITASAGMGGDSDRHLFNMIPDIDRIEDLTRTQDPDWIPITFRGIAEMKGFRDGKPPDRSWMDLSPFERDQFTNRRAYVNIVTTSEEQT
nr:GMC family oxidoreductase [Nitrospirales bacterium]